MAGTAGIVKITLLIGLQPHGKLVKVVGDLGVTIEALVEVGLAVSIQIVEDDNLVPAGDKDPALHDLEPEGLEQTGGDALPGGLRALRMVEAVDFPDIAIPAAHDDGFAIRGEVEA